MAYRTVEADQLLHATVLCVRRRYVCRVSTEDHRLTDQQEVRSSSIHLEQPVKVIHKLSRMRHGRQVGFLSKALHMI